MSWLIRSNKLLKSRFCDLNLELLGHPIMEFVAQLYYELERAGVPLRPPVWLSDEWFVPDGTVGIAIPFYLLSRDLTRLERQMIGRAEGSGKQQIMRYLRHEAGHAVDNAFGLRSMAGRAEIFGSSKLHYPKAYSPRPYSENYVKHLGLGYGQSHPDEDFAETFAVWLENGGVTPRQIGSELVREKFKFLNRSIRSAMEDGPVTLNSYELGCVKNKKRTLETHYKLKQRYHNCGEDSNLDNWLSTLFGPQSQYGKRTRSNFNKSQRTEVRGKISRALGVHCFCVDEVIRRTVVRANNLRLDLNVNSPDIKAEFLDLLTDLALEDIRRGRNKIVL